MSAPPVNSTPSAASNAHDKESKSKSEALIQRTTWGAARGSKKSWYVRLSQSREATTTRVSGAGWAQAGFGCDEEWQPDPVAASTQVAPNDASSVPTRRACLPVESVAIILPNYKGKGSDWCMGASCPCPDCARNQCRGRVNDERVRPRTDAPCFTNTSTFERAGPGSSLAYIKNTPSWRPLDGRKSESWPMDTSS